MSDRLDYWLIQHWGMTHPPIWLMWLTFFMAWAAFFGAIGGRRG